MKELLVSEIFGPTIQGEGPYAGHPAIFLRLGGCNQACTWCDTPYTWDWKRFNPKDELQKMGLGEVFEFVKGMTRRSLRHVVITGGEPMIQQAALTPFVKRLRASGFFVEIETAGTIPLTTLEADAYNVSPKLQNSGNPLMTRLNEPALQSFARTGLACLKFVLRGPTDFPEADAIAYLVRQFGVQIYAMPEGTSPERWAVVAETLIPGLADRGWILSPRLHVSIWGDRRGV